MRRPARLCPKLERLFGTWASLDGTSTMPSKHQERPERVRQPGRRTTVPWGPQGPRCAEAQASEEVSAGA